MATPIIFKSQSSWDIKRLKALGLENDSPRRKDADSICSLNTKGYSTINADITRALLYMSDKTGTDYAVVKVSSTKVAAERKLSDGSHEIVTYQTNGEIKAVKINTAGGAEPFKTLGNKNDAIHLTTLFMAIIALIGSVEPELFTNVESVLSDIQRILIYTQIIPLLEEEKSKLWWVNDYIYQKILDGSIKINIPDDGNIDMLSKRTISSGSLNGDVIYGTPDILVGNSKKNKKTKKLTVESAKKEFASFINSHNWSDEERMLIPQFPDDFPIPPEVAKMAKRYIASKSDKRPMVNFMWRGITSYGKSTGVEVMACILDMPLLRMTCHTDMVTQDFLSDFVPDTSAAANTDNLPDFETIQFDPEMAYEMLTGTRDENATEDMCLKAYGEAVAKRNSSSPHFVHVMSNYVKALTKGYIVEVQEVSRIKDAGVLVGLNEYDRPNSVIPLLDGSYARRDENAICIFTDNVGYNSCRPVDPSVLRRMSFIIDSYELPKEMVIDRIKYNTGFDDDEIIEDCYNLWNDFSQYCQEHDITQGAVSVTELEMLVMTIKYDGISNILENITDTLVSKATSDYEERQELLDFINTNISKYKELS
jgi:hypothetical protein